MTGPIALRAMVALGLAAAAVTACTTPTPYQPNLSGQRVAGGYAEQQLAPDRYRVVFSGNSLTSRDRVEGYLLYRAAEIAVRDGYEWFLIVDRLTELVGQLWPTFSLFLFVAEANAGAIHDTLVHKNWDLRSHCQRDCV